MNPITRSWNTLTRGLDWFGDWLPQLFLRLILAWEFGQAGFSKLRGENWFESVKDNFPVPFNMLPTDISWQLATWAEILGAGALVLGLFTRLTSFSLLILTVVATMAVHMPAEWSSLAELWQGYRVSSSEFGNFKLPLLFFIMLLPLFFSGAGKLSLDHLVKRMTGGY